VSAGRRRWRVVALGLALVAALAFFVLVQPPGAALPSADGGPPGPATNPAPGSLLADVLDAHGGVERWEGLATLRVRLRFGGLAFRMRLAEPAPDPRWVELDLRTPRSVFSDFPEPGQRGVFTPERVWIESADGHVLRALDAPRSALLSSRRRQIWWDDLDLLYFAGYAAWNYFQGPFLLLRDGVAAHELEPWEEDGERWRRLAVRFHDSVPTHSREQVFYYGPDLRQRRHDYRPDVFAAWADAAHYSEGYRDFGGLSLPTRRKVVPRNADGTTEAGPTLVWIEILEVEGVPAQ
jgi:hypothetical protein